MPLSRVPSSGITSTLQISALQLPSSGSFVIKDASGVDDYFSINSSGRVNLPYQPGFHAYGLNSLTSGSVCVFPSLRFNIGNHYNTSNGRFTAPITGTYLFGWTSIGKDANDVYRWRFQVNGSNVGDIHLRQDTNASGSEYATNGMYTIPWRLNATDYVTIYYVSDGNQSPYGSGSTLDDYPRFWGYLLG